MASVCQEYIRFFCLGKISLEKNPVLPTCVRRCRRMGQERGGFCPVGYAAPFLVHAVFGESGEA